MALSQTIYDYDVAIIGGGVAGLNAALVLGRACRKVAVIDDGKPRNRGVRHAYGFLTQDGVAPADILKQGRRDLQSYDVELIAGRVIDVKSKKSLFSVILQNGAVIVARKIILALGMADRLPDVPGLGALWGKHVFSCPYCDGWEMRGKPLAVIGGGKAEQKLALMMRQWSEDVTLYLNGADLPGLNPYRRLRKNGVIVVPDRIERMTKNGKTGLVCIKTKNNPHLSCSAAFVHPHSFVDSPLVKKIGCRIEDGKIATRTTGRTSVAGVYAAGDIALRQMHLITAAASGAVAAFAVHKDLMKEDIKTVPRSIDDVKASR